LVLEGGYDLGALRDGVREVLKTLARRDSPPAGERPGPGGLAASEALRVELEEPLRTFRRIWDIPAS
jgi:hypothetical protein